MGRAPGLPRTHSAVVHKPPGDGTPVADMPCEERRLDLQGWAIKPHGCRRHDPPSRVQYTTPGPGLSVVHRHLPGSGRLSAPGSTRSSTAAVLLITPVCAAPAESRSGGGPK